MKPLKTLLLWLLLLAIPLHGFANTAMAVCQASHQRISQSAGPDHVNHHTSMTEHHSDHHQHHQTMVLGDSDSRLLAGEGNADQQLSTCSACSACSIGALWLASSNTALPAFVAPSAAISYLPFHIPGVDPDRLEHPPRASLV